MIKLTKTIYFFIVILTLISCESQVSIINDAEDLKKADEFATKFYQLLMQKKYAEIFKVCENEEKSNELKSVLIVKDTLLGNILNADIENIKTTRVKSMDSLNIEYVIQTKIKYTKGETIETVEFITQNSIHPILKSYHYNVMPPADGTIK